MQPWSNVVFFCTFKLHTQGILRTDDLITRFFRISTELCVDVTYRALGDHVSLLIFLRINHFALMSLFHFVFFNLHQGT